MIYAAEISDEAFENILHLLLSDSYLTRTSETKDSRTYIYTDVCFVIL